MGELDIIYTSNEFIINSFYKENRREFIAVNTRKNFKNGHTHLKSLRMAKYLIELVQSGRINSGLSPYLLSSLQRLSNNDTYNEKIGDLIKTKRKRGRNNLGYRNIGGRGV